MPFPIDLKYITNTEQKLGIKFPQQYLEKMLRLNGGTLEMGGDYWDLFPFFDESDHKRIKRTCNDIYLETKNARNLPNFVDGAIAIANNGGGDLLVFLPRQDFPEILMDAVFAWAHDSGDLYKVADDFPVNIV